MFIYLRVRVWRAEGEEGRKRKNIEANHSVFIHCIGLTRRGKCRIFFWRRKKMKKGYFTRGEVDFSKISPNMSHGGSKKITMGDMDQSNARIKHTKKKTDLNEV